MRSNEPPGSPLDLLKIAFGDLPASWIRFMALGGLIVWAVFAVRDFRRDLKAESLAVRQALGSYVASNQAWQNASAAERQYLLSKVNARFERVYTKNGWPYEPIETISDSNR